MEGKYQAATFYLMGELREISEEIVPDSVTQIKVPTHGDVLRSLFYYLNAQNRTAIESCVLTIKKCQYIWGALPIPKLSEKKCLKKLHDLSLEWTSLQRYHSQNLLCEKQLMREFEFEQKLKEPFDISDFNSNGLYRSHVSGVPCTLLKKTARRIKF